MPVRVRVISRIPQAQAAIVKNTTDAVRDAAQYGRTYASQIAPRRTGSLADSMYVSGPGEDSSYPQATSTASSDNPRAIIVPEVKPSEAEPNVSPTYPVAVYAPGVEHSIFIEEGTRYMAPQPFLIPSSEVVRNFFLGAVVKVADI
jgi:hypothetical protein